MALICATDISMIFADSNGVGTCKDHIQSNQFDITDLSRFYAFSRLNYESRQSNHANYINSIFLFYDKNQQTLLMPTLNSFYWFSANYYGWNNNIVDFIINTHNVEESLCKY